MQKCDQNKLTYITEPIFEIQQTLSPRLTPMQHPIKKYAQRQNELKDTFNEIQLINLYETVNEYIPKIQILSRLKKILLRIPNQTETHPAYLKECNDKYYCLIINQINQNSNKQKPQSLRFLFHIVSLRIKHWFNKKEFDDIFSSFLINIEHNKKLIPFVVQFLIQLIDTFQTSFQTQNQFIQNCYPQKCYSSNQSRFSLTRKTNSQFFSEDMQSKKTWRATKQLNQILNRANSYTKQNRFQRQFLDFQLNKILIFANQVFNRAVVENPDYNYEDDGDDQQEQLFFIRMPIPNITKNLELIHKILTYDFFNDRKSLDTDQYFNEKKPLIIPTKYSKLCQFHQFQNWIKNKNDLYKYQYLYFYTNQPELKIMIVRLFGDLLRIHQKFFRKQMFFKNHIQSVVSPLKNMVQNLQIRYNSQFQLALVFGDNINKLLSNSTFPTFLNLIRNQFKSDLVETLDHFINKEIFERNILDVSLIKYYVGFFIQLTEKLSINSSEHFKIRDFKEEIEVVIKRLGQTYEDILYEDDQQCQIQESFQNLCLLKDSVWSLNLDYFETYFSIFKFYSPRKTFRDEYSVRQKCIYVCSKLQYNLYQCQVLSKNIFKDNNDTTRFRLFNRYALQSFYRLTDIISQRQNHSNSAKRQTQQNDMKSQGMPKDIVFNASPTDLRNQDCLQAMKYKLLSVNFFLEKLFSSRYGTLLIFDQENSLFNFSRSIIQMVLQIRESEYQRIWNQIQKDQLDNCIIYSHEILFLVAKLNGLVLKTRENQKQFVEQTKQMFESRKQLFQPTNRQEANDSSTNELRVKCEHVQKQLTYYQNIILQINQIFSQRPLDKQIIRQYPYLSNLTRVVQNNQFEAILEPIYSMYFYSLQKYQLHTQKHQQKMNSSAKVKNCTYKNQQMNDDQCQIIEQTQSIGQCIFAQCIYNIEKHNFVSLMNPISYYVYLAQVLQKQSLKQQLQTNFKIWYDRKVSNIPHEQVVKTSFWQIYTIQDIIKALIRDFSISYSSLQRSYSLQLFHGYVLRTCSMILKMFRSSKFQIQVKQIIVDQFFDFISEQFDSILSTNFSMFPSRNNDPDDVIMSYRVQALGSLLQSMINVHYDEARLNVYNQEFCLLFENTSLHNVTVIEIEQSDKRQIYKIFHHNRKVSELLNRALIFILNFPEELLKQGYNQSIQTQLISLIKQVYFECSQFTSIYLFSLERQSDVHIENQLESNLCKVIIDQESSSEKKYAIFISKSNILKAARTYMMLIKYVDKILRMSFLSRNQEWLPLRNKDLLSFIKQICFFLQNLQNNPYFLKIAFGISTQRNEQITTDQNQLFSALKKLYSTIFEFLRYFLTTFEDSNISFITKHLSLMQGIYDIVNTGIHMDFQRIVHLVKGQILNINQIIIFKRIPQSQIRQNNRRVSRKSRQFQFQARKQARCEIRVKYKGWEYIHRLYVANEQEILEEIQDYELRFKYYMEYKCQDSDGDFGRSCEPQKLQTTQYSQVKQIDANLKRFIHSSRKSRQIPNQEKNNEQNVRFDQIDQRSRQTTQKLKAQTKRQNQFQISQGIIENRQSCVQQNQQFDNTDIQQHLQYLQNFQQSMQGEQCIQQYHNQMGTEIERYQEKYNCPQYNQPSQERNQPPNCQNQHKSQENQQKSEENQQKHQQNQRNQQSHQQYLQKHHEGISSWHNQNNFPGIKHIQNLNSNHLDSLSAHFKKKTIEEDEMTTYDIIEHREQIIDGSGRQSSTDHLSVISEEQLSQRPHTGSQISPESQLSHNHLSQISPESQLDHNLPLSKSKAYSLKQKQQN